MRKTSPRRPVPWQPIVGLGVIWLAIYFDWSWIWGLIFLQLTLPAFYSGQTHLIVDVERRKNPLLFWAITGTWLFISLYLLVADFLIFF